jgi:hypothetical protein
MENIKIPMEGGDIDVRYCNRTVNEKEVGFDKWAKMVEQHEATVRPYIYICLF